MRLAPEAERTGPGSIDRRTKSKPLCFRNAKSSLVTGAPEPPIPRARRPERRGCLPAWFTAGHGEAETDMSGLRFYSGLFLVTAAVLLFQVIETRILSYITWYYL